MSANDNQILEYEIQPAAYRPYDPHSPEVAERLIAIITAQIPEAQVEHIGSTAVPNCDGKGVIDLMLLYEPGQLETAKAAVDGLGFQKWEGRDAFPDTRPVRLGAIVHDGTLFRIHLHLLANDAEEVARQRLFRDRLRVNPELVQGYVARKRAILDEGITYGPDYATAKDDFIAGAVEK